MAAAQARPSLRPAAAAEAGPSSTTAREIRGAAEALHFRHFFFDVDVGGR